MAGRTTGPIFAYLAERVLSLDELLPLVDRLAAAAVAGRGATRSRDRAPRRRPSGVRSLQAEQLRELAARRLMRAGRP